MKLHEGSELTSSVGETGLKEESCERGGPQHEQPRRAKETPCNRADRSNEPQAPRQSRKISQDERQKGETSKTSETSKSGSTRRRRPRVSARSRNSSKRRWIRQRFRASCGIPFEIPFEVALLRTLYCFELCFARFHKHCFSSILCNVLCFRQFYEVFLRVGVTKSCK